MSADLKSGRSAVDGGNIWIISEGRHSEEDLSALDIFADQGTLKEYAVSDIAHYLLNPNPIEIKKRLIGCEVHYRKRRRTRIKEKISKICPRRIRKRIIANIPQPEVIISNCKLNMPVLKDPELTAHFENLLELLKSYDSVTKKLPQLRLRKIEHLIGICEDFGGNLSYLKLQGGHEDKIKYLLNNVSREVGVVLRKACLADGLFELRGFDFASFNADKSHRLLSFLQEGEPKLCVLNGENIVSHWIDDVQFLRYMHLLEHSIRANPVLRQAFNLCASGQAIAIKLFFNKKLEVDYSKAHFPKVYREVFNTYNVASNKRNLVKPSLNYLQIGVSLNYVPLSETGDDRMYTHISVLHDLRALEPLRTNLPQVYSEISKGAFMSEAGRFYLLDCIEGHSNA